MPPIIAAADIEASIATSQSPLAMLATAPSPRLRLQAIENKR